MRAREESAGGHSEWIGLCLVDAQNEFQQLLRQEAETAARRLRFGLEAHFCEGNFAGQLALVGSWLSREDRPAALLMMAIHDRGLGRLVRRAAEAGVHCVFLNQTEDPLEEIRRDFSEVAICQICADELETGRIQGGLVRALLPRGGRILVVEGTRRSLTARGRTAGLEEALHETGFETDRLEAGWTAEEGEAATHRWLTIAMRFARRLDLIVCHNDSLAVGARRALERAGSELGRPDLRRLPVVGCDGAPDLGLALVREGVLAATVVQPSVAVAAVETIARVVRGGQLPPAVSLLRGTPHLAPPAATGRRAAGGGVA